MQTDREQTWWDILTFPVNWKLPSTHVAAEPKLSNVNGATNIAKIKTKNS